MAQSRFTRSRTRWVVLVSILITLAGCDDGVVANQNASSDADLLIADMTADAPPDTSSDTPSPPDLTLAELGDGGDDVFARCGNGVIEGREECDDGDREDTNGCNNECIVSCGDGVVQAYETCDTALPAGDPGACPALCDEAAACEAGVLLNDACDVFCVYEPLAVCINGDGCCGLGCDANNDSDCTATCGNGVTESGESCDPRGLCPTSCDDDLACTRDTLEGSLVTCNAVCDYELIDACLDDDGCCPEGCSSLDDDDCPVVCGNGLTELGETCDGDCPTSCNSADTCAPETLSGDPAGCSAVCIPQPITAPSGGLFDGCCPAGTNSNTDIDCSPVCGNGSVESGERCDTNCPATCPDDGDACTVANRVGDDASCDVRCEPDPITTCVDADGCCPALCDSTLDSDCSTSCGDGSLDPGEFCDGDCPTSCPDDGDACTVESLSGAVSNCTARCESTRITACLDSDGCCGLGCNASTDSDCAAACGNGVIEPGESCDGGCPTSCPDSGDACNPNALLGAPASCDARCALTPTTACVDADDCCPTGCDSLNDSDCVTINPASAVTLTSACLTSSAGGVSLIRVTLVDLLGRPVDSADVDILSALGSVGPVTANGNVYHALLNAPAAASTVGVATLSIIADGVALDATPSVSLVSPFTDLDGGWGGCPADGNVRVRVVDEHGNPLSGARVMIGDAEAADVFVTAPDQPPTGDNTAVADVAGYVTFRDLDAALDAPITVTAAFDEAHGYVTFRSVDAADLVVTLQTFTDTAVRGHTTGVLTPDLAQSGDPVEMGLMLPEFDLETFSSFNLGTLFSDNVCYDTPIGPVAMPGNVFIPGQCVIEGVSCAIYMDEKPYQSSELAYGEHKLMAMQGSISQSAASGGGDGLADAMALTHIGVVDRNISQPGAMLNINTPTPLLENIDCVIDNAPVDSNVICIAMGDWDSASDPDLETGAGRLFMTGFSFGDTSEGTPMTLAGLTSPENSGDFAGLDRFAIAIATYAGGGGDGAPPPPSGEEGGATIILARDAGLDPATGGAVDFSTFVPIRPVTRAGRDFSVTPLAPSAVHPAPDYLFTTIVQVVSEPYDACEPEDSAHVTLNPLWLVFGPADQTDWALPRPPADWPRADAGVDLEGLIDVASTPEDDGLIWQIISVHEGLNPAFEYDARHLHDLRSYGTHMSVNGDSW